MLEIVRCSCCGKEVYLPFKCPYCGKYFCAEHRLPENHACPEIWRAKAPRKEVVTQSGSSAYSYPLTYTYKTQVSRGKAIFFSLTELKHITIGLLLVFMIGFSPYLYDRSYEALGIFLILGSILAFSFILHELAHKVTAQVEGLWAEFRLLPMGTILTLISIFTPPFFPKIISPGAVMIAGFSTINKVGKTALAGPLTNIAIAAILTSLASFPLPTYLLFAVIYGAWINSFIAFFNLIPFGVMDGLKIMLWDKRVWVVAFIISIVLMIYTWQFTLLKF